MKKRRCLNFKHIFLNFLLLMILGCFVYLLISDRQSLPKFTSVTDLHPGQLNPIGSIVADTGDLAYNPRYNSSLNSDDDWSAHYAYKYDGNLSSKTVNDVTSDYTYDGNIMTGVSGGENIELEWDKNGQLTWRGDTEFENNWDGQIRSAQKGETQVNFRYYPYGPLGRSRGHSKRSNR